MAAIRLENLSKRFPTGNVAVNQVDLEIADGEFMVLVGPSGCGKSTMLRMIADLEAPTDGSIFIGDQRVDDVPAAQRDVAMVFQDYALFPHLTAADNLAFGLQSRRISKQEIASRIEEAAKLLGIQPLLERRPEELSGGERQRVALGRVLVRKPKAFLFDEPLSNLDAQLRTEMRTQLGKLHEQLKTTTLYVTHDQGEAMTLGDRVAVMRNGRVQQVGEPLEIYHSPANRFVAEFIGSPAMNFVDGKVEDGAFLSGDLRYELGSGGIPCGPCSLGFRPEGVRLADSSNNATKLADVRITLVERLGHETLAYFELCGRLQAMRLNPETVISSGDEGAVCLPQDRWYLFEASDEARRFASGRD